LRQFFNIIYLLFFSLCCAAATATPAACNYFLGLNHASAQLAFKLCNILGCIRRAFKTRRHRSKSHWQSNRVAKRTKGQGIPLRKGRATNVHSEKTNK